MIHDDVWKKGGHITCCNAKPVVLTSGQTFYRMSYPEDSWEAGEIPTSAALAICLSALVRHMNNEPKNAAIFSFYHSCINSPMKKHTSMQEGKITHVSSSRD